MPIKMSQSPTPPSSGQIESLPLPQRPKWLFIMRLVLFLVFCGALWVMGLFIWGDNKPDNLFSVFNSSVKPILSNIVNLEIVGHDDKNRLYVITATSAKPKAQSGFRGFFAQAGNLKDVEITMEWNKENWLSMRSAVGSYNNNDKRLAVGPNFNIYFSNGYQMKGLHAFINLKTGGMTVEGKVEGWALFGEISAAALEAKKGGAYMRFHDNVEVLLFPDQGEDGGS